MRRTRSEPEGAPDLKAPVQAGLAGVLTLAAAAPSAASAETRWASRASGEFAPLERVKPGSAAGDQSRASASNPVQKLADVVPALSACWKPPAGLRAFEGAEATARFSLRRDGSLIGPPRITYATGQLALNAREMLTRCVLEAIAACTPLNISPGLGSAIAGRIIAIRFIYKGPRGRGA